MASETLAIKEDYLEEFIEILERGIIESEKNYPISSGLREILLYWINEEKEYIEHLKSGE
jgi:hypothetical protein